MMACPVDEPSFFMFDGVDMDIFDILGMIGGLCLFLFGMNVMSQTMERRAGNSLRVILGKLTDSKLAGFATGLAVTALIQSSSATTVMVVGFVNSAMMTLSQAMNVIVGANVGTTVTAWILSLSGISSTNFFIRMLKPSSFTPILALIGIILLLRSKDSAKKDTGTILLAFSTLMFGLQTMSDSVSVLKDMPQFQALFVKFSNPLLGLLIGIVMTAILQSSSASVGILQSFAAAGLVPSVTSIPIIMGQNIGACVPTLISAAGTNRNAKRAAMYHLMFNLIGAAFWLAAFLIWKNVAAPAFLSDLASPLGIAIVHTSYKLLCSALILPFNGTMERLICRLVPDAEGQETKVELDERLLKAPALALQQCRVLMDDMAKAALDSIDDSLDCMDSYSAELEKSIREKEDLTDHYEDIIGTYLVKLSSQKLSEDDNMTSAEFLKLITDFERIADHSVRIVDAVLEKAEKKIVFSEGAVCELNVLERAIRHIMLLSYNAFVNKDIDSAFKVEPLEQVVDYLKEEIRTRHIRRLQRGECSIEAGFVLNDLLTAMERVSDHCSNIAGCIMDSSMHNLNLHETLNEYKHNSAKFNSSFDSFMAQYTLPQMDGQSSN